MLNKDRIRTMTRLAIYEENQGRADDKINGYFKNDYIVGHMAGSFVCGTIACIVVGILYACYHYDTMLEAAFENSFTGLLSTALMLYAAFMIFFLAVSFFVYRHRYNAAKNRLRRYSRRLERLERSYAREDKKERTR